MSIFVSQNISMLYTEMSLLQNVKDYWLYVTCNFKNE